MLWDRVLGALLLIPFALGGIWAGHRIQLRASRQSLLRVVSILLLLIGGSLLLRGIRAPV